VLAYPILQEKEDRSVLLADGLGAVPVEEDFLTLAGYYLAEGVLSGKGGKPYQQFFYFHERETEYVARLRAGLARLGVRSALAQRRHCTEVITHSLALGRLLDGLFGRKSDGKHLPEWMLKLPHAKQRILVRALWEGDGYEGCVQGYARATYCTSSWRLAVQVHQILLRLGVAAFLHHRDQRGRKRNWVISVTSRPALARLGAILGHPVQSTPGRSTGQVAIDERALYVGVRAVRRTLHAGCVYNLEVEGAHSYAVPGAAVHNCEVNGPGEARGADVGVAGGRGIGLIFRKGDVVRKVPEAQIVDALWEEAQIFLADQEAAERAARGEA
jgi:intein/homing endonuclease